MKKVIYILIVLPLFVLACCHKPMAKAEPKPATVKPQTTVRSECGVSSATGYYPSEDGAVVKLEKNMPREVAMNTKFDYTIKVTNPTDNMLTDVVVTENLAGNFKLSDTNPKAKVDGGKLSFEVGPSSKTIDGNYNFRYGNKRGLSVELRLSQLCNFDMCKH